MAPSLSTAEIEARVSEIETKCQKWMMINHVAQNESDSKSHVEERCTNIECNVEELTEHFALIQYEWEARVESQSSVVPDEIRAIACDAMTALIDKKLEDGVRDLVLGAINEVDALQTSRTTFQTLCTELIDERLGDAMLKLRGADNPELVSMCKEILRHMGDLQVEVSELKSRVVDPVLSEPAEDQLGQREG